MSVAAGELSQLLQEARLLDELLVVVRAWDGRPPDWVVDAVLRGAWDVPRVVLQRCGCCS